MTFAPILSLYRGATAALGPFATLWLNARARSGKEDGDRIQERYGRYTRERPAGPLVWLHGASVGESGVSLQLAEAMASRDPHLSFLISSGTRTSAELVGKRAGGRAGHIYAPVDRASAVRRFLAHWKPDLGVFVESEVWPNLILEAQAAGVPLALVNARMSPKTLARWRAWSATGARLFSAFRLALAADARTSEALSTLRHAPTPVVGNLKLAADPPRVDDAQRAGLDAEIGVRSRWLAASTHEGEEEILLAAHARLRESHPDALLIVAPRHPARGEAIAALAGGAPMRSKRDPIGKAPVYVADTLGELGTFYMLAPAAFVAGSLLPHLKGHNPIEAAKLGANIVVGPYVESFEDVYDALFASGGAARAAAPEDIASAIASLWADADLRRARAKAASLVVESGGAALDATVAQLCALLPASTPDLKAADASA